MANICKIIFKKKPCTNPFPSESDSPGEAPAAPPAPPEAALSPSAVHTQH